MKKSLLQNFGNWFSVFSLIVGCIFGLYMLYKEGLKEILYELLWTFGVFLVLGFLMFIFLSLFPKLFLWTRRVLESGYETYLKILFHYVLFFLPTFIFGQISKLMISLDIFWLQMLSLVLWAAALFLSIWMIMFEKNRLWFIKWLKEHISGFAPWAYAFNLILIGAYFYATLTYILVDSGSVSVATPGVAQRTIDTYLNFYTWHFLDAIPGFAITDTLQWKEPLTYESSWIGFMLLTFKIIVISPIIGAFVWYWRFVRKENDDKVAKENDDKAEKRIRKTIPRTYRPKRHVFR